VWGVLGVRWYAVARGRVKLRRTVERMDVHSGSAQACCSAVGARRQRWRRGSGEGGTVGTGALARRRVTSQCTGYHWHGVTSGPGWCLLRPARLVLLPPAARPPSAAADSRPHRLRSSRGAAGGRLLAGCVAAPCPPAPRPLRPMRGPSGVVTVGPVGSESARPVTVGPDPAQLVRCITLLELSAWVRTGPSPP
jgi:hypothetical protein